MNCGDRLFYLSVAIELVPNAQNSDRQQSSQSKKIFPDRLTIFITSHAKYLYC